MVAPVDTFVYFACLERFEHLREMFEQRSGRGGAKVVTALVLDELAAVVDAARLQVAGQPLGIVTKSESDALDAIMAGADEASALDDADEAAITQFLDRVRVRAGVRREGEQRTQDFVQAEKLTALGTLVAGVAHEVNNPLSTITLGFDVLRAGSLADLQVVWGLRQKFVENGVLEEGDAEGVLMRLRANAVDAGSLIDDIGSATQAVTELVQDLRIFSRSDNTDRATAFHPRSVIEQSLRLVKREFGSKTVIEQDYDEDLPQLCLPRNRLTQVITNLLVNAAHATQAIERPLHRVRVSARLDDQHLALSIADSGPGIAEDVLERIFDPFFTTKREGKGTGLGLSISRSIVQHMGGDLVASSVDGEGATFVCFLPLPSEEILESTKRYREPLPPSSSSTPRYSILLVDDDAAVLRTMARILREDYKVLVARDGQEACELLASGSHADLVVMELDLPELDGPDFYTWLLAHHPRLAGRVLVSTAAQERERFRTFLESGEFAVLHKPLNKEELLSAVSTIAQSVEQENDKAAASNTS